MARPGEAALRAKQLPLRSRHRAFETHASADRIGAGRSRRLGLRHRPGAGRSRLFILEDSS